MQWYIKSFLLFLCTGVSCNKGLLAVCLSVCLSATCGSKHQAYTARPPPSAALGSCTPNCTCTRYAQKRWAWPFDVPATPTCQVLQDHSPPWQAQDHKPQAGLCSHRQSNFHSIAVQCGECDGAWSFFCWILQCQCTGADF